MMVDLVELKDFLEEVLVELEQATSALAENPPRTRVAAHCVGVATGLVQGFIEGSAPPIE